MESYWVGNVAAERSVPFLAARVVSDDASDSIITDGGFVRPDGTLDYDQLASWARENPDGLELLERMAAGSRIGTASLAQFAQAVLRPEVWAAVLPAAPASR